MPFAVNLLVHDTTRQQCLSYLKSSQHGLVLFGKEGVGLYSLACELAHANNPVPDGQFTIKPEDGHDITIEQIRELYSLTKTIRANNLTVIIDDADTMGIPAQNAFLKLLEEPPRHVRFILTTHFPHLLLDTVRSRASTIEVRQVSPHQTDELLSSSTSLDSRTLSQIKFLGNGLPAQMSRLLNDESYRQAQINSMTLARQILQSSTYQRLGLLKPFMSDRAGAIIVIKSISLVMLAMLSRQVSAGSTRQLELLADCIDRLEQNGNVRIQLMKLSFSLKM